MLTNQRKIYGFDYLRAVCCILVVIWHFELFEFLKFGKYLTYLVNIFYYNFCLISVPIFFQISIILFYLGRSKKKDYLFKNRLPKLLNLYIFWVCFSIMFDHLILKNNSFNFLKNLKSFALFVVTGNNSLFYYLFSLIFVIVFTELVYVFSERRNHEIKWHYFLFLLSCVIVFLLPVISLHFKKFVIFSAYWNPLNFIPYIFSSFLLFKYFNNSEKEKAGKPIHQTIFIFILTILILFFAYLEWRYFNSPQTWGVYLMPPYSRLSLVFSTFLLTYIALKFPGKSPQVIELVSNYSLGIYCLHTFVRILINKIFGVPDFLLPQKNIVFLLTILISMFLTKTLRKVRILRNFI